MTEHVCVFTPMLAECLCGRSLSIGELCKRANATDALSAEIVIQNIIIYGEGGFVTDQFLVALKAYADILERK